MQKLLSDVICYLKTSYRKGDTLLLDPKIIETFEQVSTPSFKVSPKSTVAVRIASEGPTTIQPSPPPEKKPLSAKEKTAKKEKPPSPGNQWELKKPEKSNAALSVKDWRALYKKIAPTIYIHETPPSDALAEKSRTAYKDLNKLAPVLILADKNAYEHAPFLKNLTRAIETSIGSARLINTTEIESENRWDLILSHKLVNFIIVPKQTLFASPHLLAHYREIQHHPLGRLDQVKTLVLESIDKLYTSPEQKKQFWQFLKQQLSDTADE